MSGHLTDLLIQESTTHVPEMIWTTSWILRLSDGVHLRETCAEPQIRINDVFKVRGISTTPQEGPNGATTIGKWLLQVFILSKNDFVVISTILKRGHWGTWQNVIFKCVFILPNFYSESRENWKFKLSQVHSNFVEYFGVHHHNVRVAIAKMLWVLFLLNNSQECLA